MDFKDLPEKARELLTETGAYQKGHFQLSSGLHSPGYMQCALIVQFPEYASLIAENLAKKFAGVEIDAVLSPAVGGIVLGHEMGRALGKRAIFAERKSGELMLRRGFGVLPKERVLLVEDVITTGGSILELKGIVDKADAEVAGYTAVCDRSGGEFSPPEGVHPWISLTIPTWKPGDCPLCRRGKPLTSPGSRWQ